MKKLLTLAYLIPGSVFGFMAFIGASWSNLSTWEIIFYVTMAIILWPVWLIQYLIYFGGFP